MSIELYHATSAQCSRCITHRYSTSFSLGIRMFHRSLRLPVYSIYGFVRLADEIVDTFHDYDRTTIFQEFRSEVDVSFERGISYNPIIQAYIDVCLKYNIDKDLTDSFLDSMQWDLTKATYQKFEYEQYIFGSAEVVGLMCLKVFCSGDNKQYESLRPFAKALGSAFQKVNFLRDMKSDFEDRGRVYFPNIDFNHFDDDAKKRIELEIQEEFEVAGEGIKKLPHKARLGVFVAYKYYQNLLSKIKNADARVIQEERVRVSDLKKLYILLTSSLKYRLRLI